MTLELDEIDRSILDVLQDDARTPVSKIARRLKIGETTVRYRIRKLIRNGVIYRFTAILNPKAVGFNVVAVILINAEPRVLKKIFEEVVEYEEVQHILQMTGEHDFILVAHTRDNQHLNELTKRIRSIEGVRSALVWIATGLVKVDTKFKLADSSKK